MIIGGVCAAVTFAAMRALRLRGERWPSGPTTPSPPPPPLPLGPSEIRLASRRPVRAGTRPAAHAWRKVQDTCLPLLE